METSLLDGLSKPIRHRKGGVRPLMPLIVLVCIVGIGLSGLAGGGAATRMSHFDDKVRVGLEAPAVLRAGEYFERRLHVEVLEPIAELSVSFSQPLLEQLTINSLLPEPQDQSSDNGEYRISYGRAAAGDRFLIQSDHQVNPDAIGVRDGAIIVRDGAAEIARLTVPLVILP